MAAFEILVFCLFKFKCVCVGVCRCVGVCVGVWMCVWLGSWFGDFEVGGNVKKP